MLSIKQILLAVLGNAFNCVADRAKAVSSGGRCRYASDVTAVSQTIADAAEKWHRRLRSLAGETFSRESIDVRVLPSYTEPL